MAGAEEWKPDDQTAEVLRGAGIGNPGLWLRSHVDSLAINILTGDPGWCDFDKVKDWKGHQLVTEWKFNTTDVRQYFPLQTQSRDHLTLVCRTERAPSEMLRPDASRKLWVADIRELRPRANDLCRFEEGTFDDWRSMVASWKSASEACHAHEGCWDNGCPFDVPYGFEWRAAFNRA